MRFASLQKKNGGLSISRLYFWYEVTWKSMKKRLPSRGAGKNRRFLTERCVKSAIGGFQSPTANTFVMSQKYWMKKTHGGSDAPAACGRERELSEWQRPKFCEANSKQRILGTATGRIVLFRVGTKALPCTLFEQSQVPAQLLRSFLPPPAALPRSPSRHSSFLWVVVDRN